MAINEIHHSQMHPTITLVVANKILIIFMAHLTWVARANEAEV